MVQLHLSLIVLAFNTLPFFGAGEERILTIERDGPDGALDDVGVDLDAAIVEEAGEPFPARERVADRLGELGLLADQAELVAQPRFERRR